MNRVHLVGQAINGEYGSKGFFTNTEKEGKMGWMYMGDRIEESVQKTHDYMKQSRYTQFKLELIYD